MLFFTFQKLNVGFVSIISFIKILFFQFKYLFVIYNSWNRFYVKFNIALLFSRNVYGVKQYYSIVILLSDI